MNSILVDKDDEKFFGNGPMMLLQGVEKYGSLSSSARQMGMSYSKANKLIRNSEKALGFKLLETQSGGKNGGSSVLSKKAKIFLSMYKEFSTNNLLYGQAHLDDLVLEDNFEDIRIVILASGKGKRFKENKLLYKVNDKALIQYLLETLLPLKEYCVVSTIHNEVKDIADKYGYVYAMHEDESLSASIKEGLNKIDKGCGVIFVQADQPLLTLTSIITLINNYHQEPKYFYKLAFNDIKAAPTLFPTKYFEELKKLNGDEGGSFVIKKHPKTEVKAVQALFPWEIWDIDTKEDMKYFETMITYLKRRGND